MNRLPDVPSKLLRVALKDLLACEQDKSYEINMALWHTPGINICEVCFAGSVMAKTLQADNHHCVWPESFSGNTTCKLAALDCIRQGDIFGFFTRLKMRNVLDICLCGWSGPDLPNYHDDREGFLAWIEGFIGILEAEGL